MSNDMNNSEKLQKAKELLEKIANEISECRKILKGEAV